MKGYYNPRQPIRRTLAVAWLGVLASAGLGALVASFVLAPFAMLMAAGIVAAGGLTFWAISTLLDD